MDTDKDQGLIKEEAGTGTGARCREHGLKAAHCWLDLFLQASACLWAAAEWLDQWREDQHQAARKRADGDMGKGPEGWCVDVEQQLHQLECDVCLLKIRVKYKSTCMDMGNLSRSIGNALFRAKRAQQKRHLEQLGLRHQTSVR